MCTQLPTIAHLNTVIMKAFLVLFLILLTLSVSTYGQQDPVKPTVDLPVKAFLIGTPDPADVPLLIDFIEKDLAAEGVTHLVLRFRYQYQFKSHPELADNNPMSEKNVKDILAACRKAGIELIPKFNCFGHQSGGSRLMPLLAKYPELDETPHVPMLDPYKWPNEYGLYCKSYCPRHPKVHELVFDLLDELVQVCEAKTIHVGMDEVFYISDPKCPRCSGSDPAEVFAGEVSAIRDHLAKNGIEMWMWSDRLLDGRTTGLGEWEASMNFTHRAIDLIPKDVVLCAWHYVNAPPIPAYFATKGFRVLACPWRKADVALNQLDQVKLVKATAPPAIGERMLGVFQTTWTSTRGFIEAYRGSTENQSNADNADCFKQLFKALR